MLEGWDGVSLEKAAWIVYPQLHAATQRGSVFAPLAHLLVPEDEAKIVAWFRSVSFQGLHRGAGSHEPYAVRETLDPSSPERTVLKRDMVGLLFLGLSTFVASKSLEDGTLWPAVRRAFVGEAAAAPADPAESPAADALIGPAGITSVTRDAIDAATRRFGLPSARGDGDAQRYYQTVRFNTGASGGELPLLAQWFRTPLGAPRWFQRWREKLAGFDALLAAVERSPLAANAYLPQAQRLFPLLRCTAASFQPPPAAGAMPGVPHPLASAVDGAPLPLRLLWADGFPELALDLTRWSPAVDPAVTEITCGESFARRLGSLWNGAVEHRWLPLDLAVAPVVEVDGEIHPLPVGEGGPLFFDNAGNPVPTFAGAHAVVAWTRLQSTGTPPHWSQRHGASVALLDGQITTEDGEPLTPASPVSSLGPVARGGAPRVVDVTGSLELLRVHVEAASADHLLVRAWVGDVPLEASGTGHDVAFSGRVPAVVRGGYLRLRVEWRAAGASHMRTLDVPLPSPALAVDGEWVAVGGALEASALRERRLSYAIGRAGTEGPPSDDGTLVLACGRELLALRDRPRPAEVWGLGEPLFLARRSPHAGGVVGTVASEVVDHGHVAATPLSPDSPSLDLAHDRSATEAWALVWERDGTCSAVPLTAANGARFLSGEVVSIQTRLRAPRAIAFCCRTIWTGAAWADDWQDGLDALATTEAEARALIATLLALRVPVLRDATVSRLLRRHPFAALRWASGDDLGEPVENDSFDVVVDGRRLRAPAHAREVLRELCLDLRLGTASAAPFIGKLPAKQQPLGFQRVISWFLQAGPLPAVEFVRREPPRADLVRSIICDRRWETLKDLDARGRARELKKDLAVWTERARDALTLPGVTGRFAELGSEAQRWLDDVHDDLPLSPALRSAFRQEQMSRHVANQQILRLTEKIKP